MKNFRTAIIGGGASGLFCAAALDCGSEVLVLEKGERAGRKLSATGNGQGNVTNLNMSAERYFSFEQSSQGKISRVLSRHDERDMIDFLELSGGLFLPDERGRVYPAGRQASAVTDLLRFSLSQKNVRLHTLAEVVSLSKSLSRGKEKGLFTIGAQISDGKNRAGGIEYFTAENVVLCTGGKAAKNFGTDGSAYALARTFGHTLTPLFPSLVQLKTELAPIRGLKGIRAEARVSAYIRHSLESGKEGKLAEESGDVIFTDYGISGDAVFRLSAFIAAQIEKQPIALVLEFLPEVSEEKLAELLERKIRADSAVSENEIFCGILNNQLGRAVAKRFFLEEGARFVGNAENAKEKAAGLARAVKNFRLNATGTLGFDYAQATKGGIPLSETDDMLQSRFCEGLYFAGEILDADGQCGGYNLQWAYSSARTVADAINSRSSSRR